jgi:PAS domain S-box-containing protein
MNQPEQRLVHLLRAVSSCAALASAVVGLSVLLGWWLGIEWLKSVLPGLVTMKANTAVGLVLASASLWLLRTERPSLWARRLGQLCALAVLLLGLLTFSQYLFGRDLGIDQMLFREPLGASGTSCPGRMAPQTALSFVLVASALLLMDVETRRHHRPTQALSLVVALVSLSALCGYVYGVSAFYGFASYTQMALHTAVSFGLLSLGILCARPHRGWVVLVAQDGLGGMVARRLLPAAVGVPLLLGWVRWEGERAGLYDAAFGIALYTTAMIVVLAALVWHSARFLERVDQERRRAEEELSRYFTVSLDLFCIAGFDGYFKRLNPAWERTLGFSQVELLARPYLEFVHPDDREATRAEAQKIAGGADTISFENRYLCKDGSYRWLMWKSTPVPGQGLVYASARNITARKQDEARLQQVNAELEAANKELEAFTYSVSHDLRAPLRHIHGFSRILAEDYGPELDSTARHYLSRVEEGAEQMGELIEDLLTFSRTARHALRRRTVSLQELVEEVQKGVDTGGRPIEWRIGRLPTAPCDPALMRQVLFNLLANAVKFTRSRQPAVIEIGAQRRDDEEVVYVRDNGVGFSMKYADKLFGVFQRLHRQEEFEGTGVGLAIVQRILHKHGGRVWAEAELDNGATFYFTLGAPQAEETVPEERFA